MKKAFALMFGAVFAVACNQTGIPTPTDSSPTTEAHPQVNFPRPLPPPVPPCYFAADVLDTTFGNCGRAFPYSSYSRFGAVALMPDGKILIGGMSQNGFNNSGDDYHNQRDWKFTFSRLNTDGSRDGHFIYDTPF